MARDPRQFPLPLFVDLPHDSMRLAFARGPIAADVRVAYWRAVDVQRRGEALPGGLGLSL